MISKRASERLKVNTKAATVLSTDDTGNFRSAIIEALGKAQKVQALSPYGLCSNPPDGSLGIAFNIQGIASNTVAIIDDPKNRKKGLAKGEVALFNYVTGSIIFLKEDNGIEIDNNDGSIFKLLPGGVTEIQAETSISMSAPVIDITADTSISMTAPVINITGATAVNIASLTIINLTSAILASTGVLTASDFATAIINSLNAHGHAPGTFKDAEARPITGNSGAPS